MIRKLGSLSASSAANLSLIFVAVGWLVAAYGVLSQLGDPNPHIPAAVIENGRRVSGAMLGTGILLLLGSVWLSGYSFVHARWRASITIVACLLPAIVLFISAVS
jgi:hypothetical protein